MTYDVLIKSGHVMDGTGNHWFRSDVAVKDGKIDGLGSLKGDAERAIDAEGLTVSPGWVDLHSHSEWSLVRYPFADSDLIQGATLVVTGNCGDSAAPIVGEYAREKAERHAESLESPLYFPEYNENIVEFTEAGVPIALGAAAYAGLTASVTMAGALLMRNAMNLDAITLARSMNPGTPIVYAAEVNTPDPRTLRIPYGNPERAMTTSVINAQLSEYYGLPTFGYSGCADSKLLDA